MTIKVKDQEKDVAYIAKLQMLQSERKLSLSALDVAIAAGESKEIRLADDQIAVLKDLRSALFDMRPKG